MRIFIKKVHKWLAIPVGGLISLICLTGSILVFQDEILELLYPKHYFVKEVQADKIPLENLISKVNAQLDSNSVVGVKLLKDPNRTYQMTLKEGFRVSVFVDPYSGELTGRHSFRESPFFTIMSLHRWLLDGSRTWGKYSVGTATLLFVFILVSGFVIWMPRTLKANRFKIEFKKGKKRLLYDLHRVLGIYAFLVLLMCALTGMMWSFDWYRNSIFKVFGAETTQKEGKKEKSKEANDSQLNVRYWQNVFNMLDSTTNYEYIQIQDTVASVHLQSSITSRANDKYYFDGGTGEITKVVPFNNQQTSTKVWAWVYSLHVGNYWGIWSKIFTCFFALVGASLPLTGYYLYFAKKRKKQKQTFYP